MEREGLETLTAQIIADVEHTADLLFRLAGAMERCRTAYVSLRPSEMENALGPMLEIEARLREATARREARLVRLRALLGGAGPLTLSELERVVPPRHARRVRRARERLTGAVGSLRVEAAVGGRLLELAATAFDEMVRSLLGQDSRRSPAYDHRARLVQSRRDAGGALVSGTL